MASVEYERMLRELYALSTRGIRPGLDRVEAALARVGNPERELDVVHLAGTNGKGSVSFALFNALGEGAALFTSPHLHRFVERMRFVDGPVAPDVVADAWTEIAPKLAGGPPLTFFETTTVLALHLFRERGVRVAVLETGLGGRLDATNVFARPLACAITQVGLDHQAFLGDDVASIAREKAGILKHGVTAVIAPQSDDAMNVIEARAVEIGAPLLRVGRDVVIEADDAGTTWRMGARLLRRTDMLEAHERENMAVALGLAWTLQDRGLAIAPERVFEARWPGRLEWVRDASGGAVLLDAAHNPDGCAALARALSRRQRSVRRVLVFTSMRDKDWRSMLAMLDPVFDAVVYCPLAMERAESLDVMRAHKDGVIATDVVDALRRARAIAGEGEVVVAGSIFVVAAARAWLLGVASDPPIAL